MEEEQAARCRRRTRNAGCGPMIMTPKAFNLPARRPCPRRSAAAPHLAALRISAQSDVRRERRGRARQRPASKGFAIRLHLCAKPRIERLYPVVEHRLTPQVSMHSPSTCNSLPRFRGSSPSRSRKREAPSVGRLGPPEAGVSRVHPGEWPRGGNLGEPLLPPRVASGENSMRRCLIIPPISAPRMTRFTGSDMASLKILSLHVPSRRQTARVL